MSEQLFLPGVLVPLRPLQQGVRLLPFPAGGGEGLGDPISNWRNAQSPLRTLERAAAKWCLSQDTDNFIWEDEPWEATEHTIHEFGHAVHLDLDLRRPDLSKAIAVCLGGDWQDREFLDMQEAMALTTEWFVCQRLCIPLSKSDFQEMARIQGVYDPLNFHWEYGPETANRVLEALVDLTTMM